MREVVPGVVIDENICSGKAVIKGTRVPLELVLGKLAGGASMEEVVEEHELSREQVLATLRYAASLVEEEEVHTTS